MASPPWANIKWFTPVHILADAGVKANAKTRQNMLLFISRCYHYRTGSLMSHANSLIVKIILQRQAKTTVSCYTGFSCDKFRHKRLAQQARSSSANWAFNINKLLFTMIKYLLTFAPCIGYILQLLKPYSIFLLNSPESLGKVNRGIQYRYENQGVA